MTEINGGPPGIPVTTAQATAGEDRGRADAWTNALAAARQFLAATAEAITPDTPARDLLACATRSRAHLAALVATGSEHMPGCRP